MINLIMVTISEYFPNLFSSNFQNESIGCRAYKKREGNELPKASKSKSLCVDHDIMVLNRGNTRMKYEQHAHSYSKDRS